MCRFLMKDGRWVWQTPDEQWIDGPPWRSDERDGLGTPLIANGLRRVPGSDPA